jgi:hypothetical protein
MLTRAVFLMAAREPTGHGPAIVNTLLPVTDKEKERYEKGESKLLLSSNDIGDMISSRSATFFLSQIKVSEILNQH